MRNVFLLLAGLLCINFASALSVMEGWGMDGGISFVFLKYFLLVIFALAVYGILSYLRFFNNGAFRGVVAVLVSLLFTVFINPDDLLVVVSLYQGVFFMVIFLFPILVLGAFTLLAFERLDYVGIFLQKILWAVYGMYSLFVSLGMLLFGSGFLEGLKEIFPFDYLWEYLFKYVFVFYEFVGIFEAEKTMAILLLVSSVLILYFFVMNNDSSSQMIKDWIAEARRIKQEDKAIKSNRARDIDAEAVDRS